MQAKRGKKFRKASKLYKSTLGFKTPFKILVDGNFLHTSLQHNISLQEKLEKLFGESLLLLMPDCILQEIKSIGKPLVKTYASAKIIQRQRCFHPQKSAEECLKTHIGK